MEKEKEWFAEWFDSPYYHILYQKRDMNEAEFFLRNLIKRYNPAPTSKIIDLACGKGRHSIFLNSLGFDVTGVDLSSRSIGEAKKFENNKLHFEVQDLRSLAIDTRFDLALNLFTSFGYFDSLETDILVLKQIYAILKPEAFLFIDFFNVDKVIESLVQSETKKVCDINFEITKKLKDGLIIKNICFNDAGQIHTYQEKVQALSLADFEYILKNSGFKLLNVFGNYSLDAFDKSTSERLIIQAGKSNVG